MIAGLCAITNIVSIALWSVLVVVLVFILGSSLFLRRSALWFAILTIAVLAVACLCIGRIAAVGAAAVGAWLTRATVVVSWLIALCL